MALIQLESEAASIRLDEFRSRHTLEPVYDLEVLNVLTREELLELADKIRQTFGPPAQTPTEP